MAHFEVATDAGDRVSAHEVWQEHGKSALITMATKQPSRFVQMVALLIPAHFRIEHKQTEEQIEERIIELSAALGLGNGATPKLIGGNGTSGGAR